jgi:hypothetical protein
MNRAERRRAARDYRHGVRAIHEASHGVFQLSLITPPIGLSMLAAAKSGNAEAARYLCTISRWMKDAEKAAPGEGRLCLLCSAEMAGKVPVAFTIVEPAAAIGPALMVGAICKECARGDDLVGRVLAVYREI